VDLNVKVANGNFKGNCYGCGEKIYFVVKKQVKYGQKICGKISDTFQGIFLRKTKIRIQKNQMTFQRNHHHEGLGVFPVP
jgi:hypothetical protein